MLSLSSASVAAVLTNAIHYGNASCTDDISQVCIYHYVNVSLTPKVPRCPPSLTIPNVSRLNCYLHCVLLLEGTAMGGDAQAPDLGWGGWW